MRQIHLDPVGQHGCGEFDGIGEREVAAARLHAGGAAVSIVPPATEGGARIAIVRCDDGHLLDEARKIRYAFYVEELAVIDPAEAPDGMIRDAYDAGARVFLGYAGGRPLITCRLIDLRTRPFEMSQFIDPHRFVTDERSAEITRFLCRREGRHSAVVWHMLSHIYQDCAISGVRYLYFSKREEKVDPSLLTFFEKLGAVCVSDAFQYGPYGPHRAYRIDLRSVQIQTLWSAYCRRRQSLAGAA